jgi:hypothetical protein
MEDEIIKKQQSKKMMLDKINSNKKIETKFEILKNKKG